MDVVFHSHFRSSESVTIVFITPFLESNHMEVFQNQQNEPTRLGVDLPEKSAWQGYLWIPKGAPGIAGRRSRGPPPRAGPACSPWAPLRRRGLGRSLAGGHRGPGASPPSPSGRPALLPRGVWGNGLRRPRAPGEARKTVGGWLQVCRKKRSFPRLSFCKSVASTFEQWTPLPRSPAGFFTGQRGLTDSPCLHYSRDGVRLVQTG